MLLKAKTDMLMTIWGRWEGERIKVGWCVGSWLSGLSDGWGYYYLLKVEKFPRNRFWGKNWVWFWAWCLWKILDIELEMSSKQINLCKSRLKGKVRARDTFLLIYSYKGSHFVTPSIWILKLIYCVLPKRKLGLDGQIIPYHFQLKTPKWSVLYKHPGKPKHF